MLCRWWLAVGLVAGCSAVVDVPDHIEGSASLPASDPVDHEALARVAADAEARPGQEAAQFRAGIEHAHAALVGHFEYQEAAERYLLRAHELEPGRSPATLILARFLNLRSSALDLSRVDLQARLYGVALARARDGCDPALRGDAFHVHALRSSAQALSAWDDGQPMQALHRVRRLERELAAHVAAHPDDVDAHVMAGNFELTWAGVIGVGSRRRLEAGIAYLERSLQHWPSLSAGARDVGIAPNVQSVFTLALAEAQLAAGRTEAAATTYAQLLDLDVPHTRAREQIEALARHRLDRLDAYAGEADLLPPWPHGPTACVACHARTTELPATGLHLQGRAPW
jgi:hypothetical protein